MAQDIDAEHTLDARFCCRPLTPRDAAAVAALEDLCFPSAWTAAQYESQLATPFFGGYGCWHSCPDDTADDAADRPADGLLAGYLVYSAVAETWEIVNVAVVPALRGRGLGGLMLAQTLIAAKEQGALACFLEVRTGNVPARALYASAGFVQVGCRPKYYPGGEDALVLEKRFV